MIYKRDRLLFTFWKRILWRYLLLLLWVWILFSSSNDNDDNNHADNYAKDSNVSG